MGIFAHKHLSALKVGKHVRLGGDGESLRRRMKLRLLGGQWQGKQTQ
jgi:hypothetical protein